jgi:hypothetical protein
VSSLGTASPPSHVYRSDAVAREHIAQRKTAYRRSVIAATAIAALLTMLGVAAILAGLIGVIGVAPMGFVRAALYLGLGFAGAGSGGILLIVLSDLRPVADGDVDR